MDNQQMNPGMPQAPAKKGGALKWIVIIIVLALIIWGAIAVFGGGSEEVVPEGGAETEGTPTETAGQPVPTVEGEVVSDVEVTK